MRCYGCGTELPEGAKYCLSCGKKVGDKNGERSSKNVTGTPEHIQAKREGKPFRLPLVFDVILGVAALILLVMLYVSFSNK